MSCAIKFAWLIFLLYISNMNIKNRIIITLLSVSMASSVVVHDYIKKKRESEKRLSQVLIDIDIDEIIKQNTAIDIANQNRRIDEAVKIIKEHEGWHGKEHYPYVGYGHRLLPSDTFNHNITEEFATKILKDDLLKKCAEFREFGRDSLILGVLAYNVGEYHVKGGYGHRESTLIKKIKDGDRNIRDEYLSFCNWKGRKIPSIRNRRAREFDNLFVK